MPVLGGQEERPPFPELRRSGITVQHDRIDGSMDALDQLVSPGIAVHPLQDAFHRHRHIVLHEHRREPCVMVRFFVVGLIKIPAPVLMDGRLHQIHAFQPGLFDLKHEQSPSPLPPLFSPPQPASDRGRP